MFRRPRLVILCFFLLASPPFLSVLILYKSRLAGFVLLSSRFLPFMFLVYLASMSKVCTRFEYFFRLFLPVRQKFSCLTVPHRAQAVLYYKPKGAFPSPPP